MAKEKCEKMTTQKRVCGDNRCSTAPYTCRAVILATIGFRQTRARMAANRLPANAAQRTGSQEPVVSSSLAAPHPEKIDAIPLEV